MEKIGSLKPSNSGALMLLNSRYGISFSLYGVVAATTVVDVAATVPAMAAYHSLNKAISSLLIV